MCGSKPVRGLDIHKPRAFRNSTSEAELLIRRIESGRGLPHSKTLRDGARARDSEGLGVRQSSAFCSRLLRVRSNTLATSLFRRPNTRSRNRAFRIAREACKPLEFRGSEKEWRCRGHTIWDAEFSDISPA